MFEDMLWNLISGYRIISAPAVNILTGIPPARGQDHWDCGVLEGNKSRSYSARKEAGEEFFPAKCAEEMKENVR